jgi:hypothetical protein
VRDGLGYTAALSAAHLPRIRYRPFMAHAFREIKALDLPALEVDMLACW